jgi:hypothetical protein
LSKSIFKFSEVKKVKTVVGNSEVPKTEALYQSIILDIEALHEVEPYIENLNSTS